MKRLKRARPITHRQIPIQVGLDFPTYEQKLINNGEIEDQFQEPLKYYIEDDCDNLEWRAQQDHNTVMI
jgi:hypothetical protein